MRTKTAIPPHFSTFVRTDKPHISNSYLSTLKRALLGENQFYGSERFLHFGTEHHLRILEKNEAWTALQPDEEVTSANMKAVTDSDKKFQSILRGARTEVEVQFIYRGVLVLMYVDILKSRKGWDYKTTKAKSEAEFIRKAREADYWRQAALYMAGTKRKDWEIVGQQKEDPCGLFWLPIMDYPQYLAEGIDELNVLVDTHKELRKYYESRRPI